LCNAGVPEMNTPVRGLPGLRGRAPYPQLALGEKVLAESTLGGDLALLTDRRLVVAGRDFENSFALAQIGLVRSAFRRSARDIAIGTALVLAGLALLAIAGPLKSMLATQIASFEAAGPEAAGASLTAVLLRGTRNLVWFLPLAGLALAALGLARAAIGVLGTTTVSVHAGGGELMYARRGRQRALDEFIREVARTLPAPPPRVAARPAAAAAGAEAIAGESGR
jgi:hypothetical protein